MVETTRKVKLVETATKMGSKDERLHHGNKRIAVKLFFYMYLIRPRLSPAMSKLASEIVQIEP